MVQLIHQRHPKEKIVIDLFKQGSATEFIASTLKMSHIKVIFILSGNRLLICEKSPSENDRRIILDLYDAGVLLSKIAEKLSLDIKLVIGTVYTADQLVNLYQSQQSRSSFKHTSINYSPRKEPQNNELKLLDILEAKDIIREMFTGKKVSEIAKEHDKSVRKIFEMLSSVGIDSMEIQKIKTLTKCRDILISRKLIKEGYDIANIAMHFQVWAISLKTCTQIAIKRLPFTTESDLIREYNDLCLHINTKIGERCPTIDSNHPPDNNCDEFLKGEAQRSLRNSTPHCEQLAAALIKEIEAGKKLQDISSEFKLSIHKIKIALKLSNTDIKTIRQRVLEQNRDIWNKVRSQFRTLLKEGKTLKEIACITGYSEQRLINLRMRTDILYTSTGQQYVKDAYIQGVTISQIAQDFRCSQKTIGDIIYSKQLKTKTDNKENIPKYTKPGKKPLLEVIEALYAGWSIQTIVDKGMASQATVYRYKKALKL
ncbi:hypothetical protein ACTJJ0_12395 [Chitinophaga sp. 22321]|uniref:Helix-turn-helix domain of resolvase n=1 Tax=Chitinophaga hostae TaxID=2831022 RepID=A0ABS5IWB1_9BACT|nr:hypothetical protein [Chitinophaga hostae]MBS0027258.1 hypothetical protein [Chitinophaga hostae]